MIGRIDFRLLQERNRNYKCSVVSFSAKSDYKIVSTEASDQNDLRKQMDLYRMKDDDKLNLCRNIIAVTDFLICMVCELMMIFLRGIPQTTYEQLKMICTHGSCSMAGTVMQTRIFAALINYFLTFAKQPEEVQRNGPTCSCHHL